MSKASLEASDESVPLNIYEEEINEETTLDLSSQGLSKVPEIKNPHLCVSSD